MIDGTTYKDQGCSLALSCLRCPFAQCRYDADLRLTIRMKRDSEIREMQATGFSTKYIADHFSVSASSVTKAIETQEIAL